jgi:alkylation response protein AidB-like acyl-CoA dehydrogenase
MLTLTLEEAVRRTREVTVEVVQPGAERTDREARWPTENFEALLMAGLGGLVVPRTAGGLGAGLSGLARVCEELGKACPSTAISFGMHHVGAAVLSAKATAEQMERFVEPIARGQHLTTLALSEPGTGAHFYLPETQLTHGADGALLVNGKKSFVTNAGHADSYVSSVVALGEGSAVGEFSCIVLSKGEQNLRWGPPWQGLGMRGNDARTLELRDVRIPRSQLLGEEGDQIWYMFNIVAPYFLIAMSGTYLGIATAALEEARSHLGARHYTHSGNTLASEPLLQHRMGTLWAKVARTRALVHYAAEAGDRGAEDALLALCSAKAEVAECTVDVVNETLTLLGGKGYSADSRVHRMLRDARAAHVMSPTTDLLRTWTGRALLDLPILSG